MILSRLRPHLFAVFLALLVGAVLSSGELLSRVMLGSSYRGLPTILSAETGDEAWYHAVLRETAIGGEPWNPIIAEAPASTPPTPVLAEKVMSLPIRTGLTVHSTVVLWRFLLGVIASLVIYIVTLAVSRSRGFALLVSVAVPSVSWVIAPFFLPLSTFTLFDRPVHPQFEIPIVFTLLGCVVMALEKRGREWLFVVVGLLLTVLIYSYVWAWTWGFVFIGILLFERLARRAYRDAALLFGCLIGAALLGLPAFISLFRSLGQTGSYAVRLGLEQGRMFADALINLPLVFGLGVLLLSRRSLSPTILRFAGVGIGATFIAANQQLVTGRAFQPDHYVLLIGAPLVLWVALWAIWTRIATRGEMARQTCLAIVIGASLIVQLAMQYRIAVNAVELIQPIQPLADVMAYLDQQSPNGAVVFADQDVGILIPALSRHKLWWQTYALAAPQPEERIREAAFVWFSLAQITPTALANINATNLLAITRYFSMSTSYAEHERLAQEEVPIIKKAFETFLQSTDASIAVRSRTLDYILSRDGDAWDPHRLGPIDEVFSSGPFTLYRVLPLTP